MKEVSSSRSPKLICEHKSHNLSFILFQLHNSEQLGLEDSSLGWKTP